jgi:hypothetical protein
MDNLALIKKRSLQSPDIISKYIIQLKLLYLKNSSNIVFELIKEWETKLNLIQKMYISISIIQSLLDKVLIKSKLKSKSM